MPATTPTSKTKPAKPATTTKAKPSGPRKGKSKPQGTARQVFDDFASI